MLGVAERGIRKRIVFDGSVKKKVPFNLYTKGKAEVVLKAIFSLSVILSESSL